ALEVAREGLEVNRRQGERAFTMLDNAVHAAIRVGEWDWAVAQIEEALPEETDAMARGSALATLHQLRTYRGLDSGELIAELRPLVASLDSSTGEAFMELVEAYAALASGDPATARTKARRFMVLWPQGEGEGWR